MNPNVHLPHPAFSGQPNNFQPRRDGFEYQNIPAPIQGAFHQPQAYIQLQDSPRPNYPALSGPYSHQGFQPLNSFDASPSMNNQQPRIPPGPGYPTLSNNPNIPHVIQQGVVYQHNSGYSYLPQYADFNYMQPVPISGLNDSYGDQGSNQVLIPQHYAQVTEPQSRAHQIETRIKGGYCFYTFLLYLGLISWIFNLFVIFSGRGRLVFKILEVILSLGFLTGFILAIKAKSSLTSKKQFYVFVIFSFITLAQLIISILSIPSLSRKFVNFHGHHRNYGHHGQNGWNGDHHGWNGHQGNEGQQESQGYNGQQESNVHQYGNHEHGYNGFHGHYRYGCGPIKGVLKVIFFIILPFIMNVMLTCYARSLSKLMKERENLFRNFRSVNRMD